jgi:hypothetical protein
VLSVAEAREKSRVPTARDRTGLDPSSRRNSGCRKADGRAALNEQKYPDCVNLKPRCSEWKAGTQAEGDREGLKRVNYEEGHLRQAQVRNLGGKTPK